MSFADTNYIFFKIFLRFGLTYCPRLRGEPIGKTEICGETCKGLKLLWLWLTKWYCDSDWAKSVVTLISQNLLWLISRKCIVTLIIQKLLWPWLAKKYCDSD